MDETDWASNMETRERAACVDAVRDAASTNNTALAMASVLSA